MSNSQIAGVLLVLIMVLLLGLVPAIAVSTQDDKIKSVQQIENKTYHIQDSYYSNVTFYNSSSQEINLKITYNDTSYETSTQNIPQETTVTYTVNGNEFDVTNEDSINDRAVFVKYEYSTYLGFPPMAKLIVSNAALIILAITILLILAVILMVFKE